ncbi:MAG: sugar-binding transcriptional regulator [Alphaproteobacteria bacterium]|nr:sugar-binding transcriptional regulator [Alphaproteobacteria bacterium]
MGGKATGIRRASGQISGDDVIVEAAWMYYHDGLNQSDIADRLGLSRASVVNYLQEARERGLVTISLDPDAFTRHRLVTELCARFNLRAAYLVPDATVDEDEALLRVARGAAAWLPRLLASGDRLGVSWGRNVYEVARATAPTQIADLTVIQLLGSMATPYGFTAEVCSTLLAQRLGAACINLHAPAVLSDPAVAEILRKEPIIQHQLDALATCNKVIFAAGASAADSHVATSGVASPEDVQWYAARGAVGVVCGRFINPDGAPIPGPLDARIIGIPLSDLAKADLRLLVSTGPERTRSMLAALRGGLATHAVTSVKTARALLESD